MSKINTYHRKYVTKHMIVIKSPGQVMAGRGDVGPGSSDGRAPDM